MADTRVQLEVEDWVRENWMQGQFGQKFYRNRLKLSSGGVFDFDAVSEDKSVAACISTSEGKTSASKFAVGKLLKVRSDMLFLHLAVGLKAKLLVLVEPSMHEVCQKELNGGRTPPEVQFILASIPDELRQRLIRARAVASREVTPEKVEQLPNELVLSSPPKAPPT
jgi:hypothetical protein